MGERFRDGITGRDGRDGAWHTVVGFEDRMDLLWAATDLLVGRGEREHRGRDRHDGHAVDPRAVGRVGRRPPDHERSLAVRRGGRRAPARIRCRATGRGDRRPAGASRAPQGDERASVVVGRAEPQHRIASADRTGCPCWGAAPPGPPSPTNSLAPRGAGSARAMDPDDGAAPRRADLPFKAP